MSAQITEIAAKLGARISATFGRPETPRIAVRVPHPWHEAYTSALRECDPGKLIGRIEYAICAIERRCSEWRTDPGTSAELMAIQKCLRALGRRMKQANVAEGEMAPGTKRYCDD
jgi:hypothetical protein